MSVEVMTKVWADSKQEGGPPFAACGGSADSQALRAELERVRAEKQPTRRGILTCGAMMAQMIRLGWRKEQLDALELVFWQLRDADGRLNPPNR